MALERAYLAKLLTDAGYDLHSIQNNWIIGRSSVYRTEAALWEGSPTILALPTDVAIGLNIYENAHFVPINNAPDGLEMGMALSDYEEIFKWLKKSVALTDTYKDANFATDLTSLVKLRKGQQKLREDLLAYWDGQCAVTNIKTPEFLVTSHIKPWSACRNDTERVDLYNALLLNVSLDRAFDRGLISFGDNGKIILSPLWNWQEAKILGIFPNMQLRKIDIRHKKYLQFHRKQIFQSIKK